MRRSALVVFAALLVVGVVGLEESDARRLKWDLPPASVTHASDGMGLTNGSLSLHRAFSSRHGMLGSFEIYGAQYTWTLPAEETFLLPGWTYDSVVSCSQCHSWVGATGSLPAEGYPGLYEDLRLDGSSANGMSGTTGDPVICEKCHDLVDGGSWSNAVHASSKHRGADGQCVMCHVQLPHGSGLPRLLGYAQDPSPYSTAQGGLSAIALRNHAPGAWRKRDCSSGCHLAGPGATVWPSGGSVGGVVLDGSGVPVADATVTVTSGATATTDGDGSYRIDNLGAGYATVRVTAEGYSAYTRYVTITAGALLEVDATLAP